MKPATAAVVPWTVALGLRVWAGTSPAQVERAYARGAFPFLAAGLDHLSAWTPLSLAEILSAGLLLAAVLVGVRAVRRIRREGGAWAAVARGVGLLGATYVLFLVLWGLNYEREPVATILGLDARPSAAGELRELARELVSQADALREGLPEDGTGALRLSRGEADVLRRVSAGFDGLGPSLIASGHAGARIKTPFSSPLLAYLGIAGIYVPFTGEPHLNGTLPASEVPFTASHEMAHRYGFAREDEANYVGYLACRSHSDAEFRYSGAFRASLYAVAALYGVDPQTARTLQDGRSPAVHRDLRALSAWHRRYASRAAEVQRRVNDAYLRSQGQEQGVKSYGHMVDLLLAERRSTAPDPAVNRDRPTGPAPPPSP